MFYAIQQAIRFVSRLTVICLGCSSASCQQPHFSTLPQDGSLASFIAAFQDTPSISELRQRVRFNSVEIVYFVCPESLALVRVNLVSSLDKSRFTVLLRPVIVNSEPATFREITSDQLLRCGIDAESIFRALMPDKAPSGMGAAIGPLVEMRVRDSERERFQRDLLGELIRK